MPRPMRLAAPVTRTTGLNDWVAMNLHLVALDAQPDRSAQASGHMRPRPEERRARAQDARYRADRARVVFLGSNTGSHHRDHHDRPGERLDSGEDAAAELIGNGFQKLRKIEHGANGHGRAGERDEEQRPAVDSHLAEDDVGRAVDQVAHKNRSFVGGERNIFPHHMADRAADQQADSRKAPDGSNASGTAMENEIAEEAEENLRRSATARPPDGDEPDAKDARPRLPSSLSAPRGSGRKARAAAKYKRRRPGKTAN